MSTQKIVERLASRLEKSKSVFKTDVLDKSIHIVILDREAVKAHAKAQVEAVLDRLDKRKVTEGVISAFADLIYSNLSKGFNSFNNTSISFRKLSPGNASDIKILRNVGQRFTSSSQVFRLRPLVPIDVFKVLKSSIFTPTNKKSAAFLNKLLLSKATRLSIRNGLLDVSNLFSASNPSFKVSVQTLLKAADNVPKQRRAAYRAAIRNLAVRQVKNLKSKFKNSDWGIQANSSYDITTKRIFSNTVLLVSSKSPTDNQKKEEQAALEAINKLGKEFFEEAVAEPETIGKIEQSLLNATIDALKNSKSGYKKKGKGKGITDLSGTTKVSPVVGRGSVWTQTKAPGVSQVSELIAVKNILNLFLPIYMQRNMGKGNSKTLLNYRTGRLARSAAVESLLPSRKEGVLEGRVDYMRPPYDTFAPGGDKDMPRTRNPKLLVDKSIRQILKEKLQIAMAFESELI